MSAHLTSMQAALDAAKTQFSLIQGRQEDNIEVLQELADAFMSELSQLVHAAGGDSSFLTPVVEGIRNDIALCFFENVGPVVSPVFKPRRGLGNDLVQGFIFHAAE